MSQIYVAGSASVEKLILQSSELTGEIETSSTRWQSGCCFSYSWVLDASIALIC